MRLIFLGSAVLALRATRVVAHGYVQEITLGATKHTAFLPFHDPYVWPGPPDRIVRKIPGNGPIEDLSLIDLQCNGWSEGGYVGSAPAALVGTVEAGATVTFNWTYWPDSHKGPILTYLARVPEDSDARKWEPGTAAIWFKISQDGKDADGVWATPEKLWAADGLYSTRIPRNLRPGQYLMRHEILALHSAWAYPGVQAYPSCTQIEVTGNGTAFPTSFVAIPGVYKPDTPGILFDIYTDPSLPYPIPGPDVWTGGD